MSVEWLEAIDGTAYLTDPAGVILAVGRRGWDEFSTGANADLPTERVVGRSLFGFMTEGPVRSTCRALHDAVVSGPAPRLALAARCDAPDVERSMRLSISSVLRGGKQAMVLYQAQIVDQRWRPPMRHLAAQQALGEIQRVAHLPMLQICSFCSNVGWPAGSQAGEWVTPSTYYQRGGVEDVRLSHGVCPSCIDTVARLTTG